MNLTPEIQKEIKFLEANYTQEDGIDIVLLLEMIDEKINDIASEMPFKHKIDKTDSILNQVWQMATLVKIVQQKINNDLFMSIEELVYHLSIEELACQLKEKESCATKK